MTKSEEKKVNKKKKTMAEKKKEQYSNDFFMLTMLLSVTAVLSTALKAYEFNLFNQTLVFSFLVFPFIIFISNYITKRHTFKESLFSIVISSLMMIAFLLLIDNLTNQRADILEIFGYLVSYFGSMFINLVIYYYIITNMTPKSIMIGLNYMFTIVLNSFLHLLFFNDLILSDSLWIQFTISIVVQFVISIFLVFIDRKIERGVEI